MAAGVQVCSFQHDRSSTPTAGHYTNRSNLLMNLKQHQFWQTSRHPSDTEVVSDMKVGESLGKTQQKFHYCGTSSSLFKHHLFSSPICSQSLVQKYLRNISFGVASPAKSAFGICSINLLEMGHSNATENVVITKEMTDFNSCETEATSKKPANQNHDQELCSSVCDGFSPQDDECYEFEDHGSECSSDSEGRACDFDNDDDDDLVEFSEEVIHEMESQQPISECAMFLSLCSNESGYFENRSDSPCSCNETSDNENDQVFEDEMSDNEGDQEFDHETSDTEGDQEFEHKNDFLWNCFELQALSPFITCGSQQNSSHFKCNTSEPPPSSDSQLSVSHTNSTCGLKEDESLVRNMQCHSKSAPNISVHNSEQCTSDTASVNNKTPTNSTCKKRGKHVSFKPDSELAVVHLMISWDFAYRAARKGPWEQYARDRQHFKRRIDSVSSVITPCLVKKLKALSTT